jgi:bifunctional enzyme CysN/CysC
MTVSVLKKQPDPAALAVQPDLNIVILGHVDHGKSTLIGRLLHDTGSLEDGKLEQIKASSARRGMPFEWAFLMDALQAERDQNVTIDTSRIWFSTESRRYCLIDAPGHREFIRNMITGAASANAALLLIDAQEGMKEQSRRHASLLAWLGIEQVIVLINKMDLVAYDQSRFDALVSECQSYLTLLNVTPQRYIPISAREGEMIAHASAKMQWYRGPALLDSIDELQSPASRDTQPLRIAVQDVYRFDARRIIAGRIESGTVKVGDTLLFSPTNMTAKVKSFERWPEEGTAATSAQAGESVGFVLDEQIFVERGHVASHVDEPPLLTNRIPARLFWLSHTPLREGASYRFKIGTAEYQADVQKIERVYNNETLSADAASEIKRHEAADVMLRIKGMAVCDDFQTHPASGRFVLFDGYEVAGGGIIDAEHIIDLRSGAQKSVKSSNIMNEDYGITPEARAAHNGHRGGVLWFTGLSGSGKSTLARELQKRLFMKGYQVMVLDGDNVRRGLCSDLGFSPEDRAENIRRVGEVAALFAQAGMIVITALISPYADDRRRVRAIAPEYFNTIYIKAGLDVCEKRDSKGLYQKARAGEIKEFTGISAPYEEPEQPDMVIDTADNNIAACTDLLYDYVERTFVRSFRQDRESYSI